MYSKCNNNQLATGECAHMHLGVVCILGVDRELVYYQIEFAKTMAAVAATVAATTRLLKTRLRRQG
jgi:hypothetical protein